ncbi:MAG: 2-dehydropantoate 2-reductase [Gammaproteobacteria bacterium]|jgi:2-dehydropantoate 2-reductase|nr:2-dehydropantoate 2-reductase [Gammaproteobacteria bacterium]
MRILVVGAGAIGGYFGARLAEAGQDVTFLVRPKRAAQLASGLFVRSPQGNVHIAAPRIVTEAALREPFDLILLSCKAFDLDTAMDSFARAVGPHSLVLPLLNGLAHIGKLQSRFGSDSILGGQCQISTTLDEAGRVIHLNETHTLGFGELDGARTERIEAVKATLVTGKFAAALSRNILQEMWEKWLFIATMAGITCLMRASLGDIETGGGQGVALSLFDECAAVAAGNGHGPRAGIQERIKAMLTAPGSTLTASMLRDVEARKKTEHEHILGDFRARAGGLGTPVLEICLAHMRAYEARRLREG